MSMKEKLILYKQQIDGGQQLIYYPYIKDRNNPDDNDNDADLMIFDCLISNKNEHVYIATANRVLSIDARDGNLLWIKKFCLQDREKCNSKDSRYESKIRDIELDERLSLIHI